MMSPTPFLLLKCQIGQRSMLFLEYASCSKSHWQSVLQWACQGGAFCVFLSKKTMQYANVPPFLHACTCAGDIYGGANILWLE